MKKKQDSLPERFRRNLTAAREAKGLSKIALAEKAGIHRVYLSEIEHGHKEPGLSTIAKLAEALEIEPSTLLH